MIARMGDSPINTPAMESAQQAGAHAQKLGDEGATSAIGFRIMVMDGNSLRKLSLAQRIAGEHQPASEGEIEAEEQGDLATVLPSEQIHALAALAAGAGDTEGMAIITQPTVFPLLIAVATMIWLRLRRTEMHFRTTIATIRSRRSKALCR